MSDTPQTDDGYTRIANELLDALLRAGLSSRQWAVAMAIVRKTYGYNKKSDDIGLSQLCALTTLDKSNLSKTVTSLVEMRIVTRSEGTFGHVLGINKDYKQWGTMGLSKQPPLSIQPPLSKQPLGGGQFDQAGVVKTTTTKDKPTKDKPKRHTANADAFARFWAAYPRKCSKGQAEKAFAKINPDEQLMATILAAIERAKTSEKWKSDGGKFIQYPATWLNAKGWEDETEDQLAGIINPELAHLPPGAYPLGNGRYRLNGQFFDRNGRKEVSL